MRAADKSESVLLTESLLRDGDVPNRYGLPGNKALCAYRKQVRHGGARTAWDEQTCLIGIAHTERGLVVVDGNERRALEGERILGEVARAGRALGGDDPEICRGGVEGELKADVPDG